MPLNLKSVGGGAAALTAASTPTDVAITIPATPGTLAVAETIAASGGASLVGYLPSGTGAVATNVQNKLRESVSVKDFGAKGDGVTDDTAAIQAAVTFGSGKTILFPEGVYIVSSTVNLPSNIRLLGDNIHSVVKLKSQVWGASNGLMFSLSGGTDVHFESLVFDGNKGNIGTARSPIFVVFNSQRIRYEDCTFQNCEGICLNISTDSDDTEVLRCKFINCGGNPNNSDGYRKQAIAFATNGVARAKNIRIEGCYFYRQGLDCISLSDCDNVTISGNTAVDGYTLVYNNPFPSTGTNIAIYGNVVRVCSEFGAATSVPPVAIDLPNVDGLIVSDNTFYDIDACAIGLFNGTKNATVSGNTIVNPMRSGSSTFVSGILVGGQAGEVALDNIVVEGNLIVDTAVTPLMKYGITVKSDATNVLVKDNVIRNPLLSRYGRYSTDAFAVNISAFTSNTQVSVSARIVDVDVANNLETVHGRFYVTTTDNSNPAVRITQTGTSDCLAVEDSATPDGTLFVIDTDGDVGIRISSGTFGGPLSVSGTGANNLCAFQAFGNDAFTSVIGGRKTRNTSPYAQGLVQNGDLLVRVEGAGSDGAAYRQAGYIQVVVDGVAAAADMPGRIEFFTTPAASVTPIRRLILKATGALRFSPQSTPTTAESGDVYYDSTTNKLRCYNGTIWNDLY